MKPVDEYRRCAACITSQVCRRDGICFHPNSPANSDQHLEFCNRCGRHRTQHQCAADPGTGAQENCPF